MYTQYCGLATEPFGLTPDPGFVYPHPSYRAALARMRDALHQGEGLVVVTGGAGTGKTTLLEDLLAGPEFSNRLSATLVSTNLEQDDFLRMVAYSFGIDAKGQDKATLIHQLKLLLQHQPGALLIIDEAQNLPGPALAEVHMLCQLKVNGRPMLQVILLGDHRLPERILAPELEQLHQLMVTSCTLQPLTLQETADFIRHRLHCAGWRGSPAISAGALILIHRFARGVPRNIGKLCSRLLLRGAVEQLDQLDMDEAVSVIQEIQQENLLPMSSASGEAQETALPDIQDLVRTVGLPIEQRLLLSEEEQAFLQNTPVAADLAEAPPPAADPASCGSSASQVGPAGQTSGTATRPVTTVSPKHPGGRATQAGYAVAASALLACTYLLGTYSAKKLPEAPDITAASPPAPSEAADKALPDKPQALAGEAAHHHSPAPSIEATDEPTVPTPVDQPPPLHPVPAQSLAAVGGSAVQGGDAGEHGNAPAVPEDSGPDPDQPSLEPVIARLADSPEQTASDPASGSVPDPESETQAAAQPMPAAEAAQAPAAAPELTEKPANTPAEPVTPPQQHHPGERIDTLLQLAEEAISRDRLCTPPSQSAWHFYKQILAVDPAHPGARDGLNRIVARYGVLARLVMDRQEYDKAQVFLSRGLEVIPGDDGLLALQRELLTRREQARAQLAGQQASDLTESGGLEPEPAGLFGTLKAIFTGKRGKK